jgi:hypothetical protein
MDTAATLALLLNRVFDGAAGGPDHETASAILDEAARFAGRHLTTARGHVRHTRLPDGGGPREDGGRTSSRRPRCRVRRGLRGLGFRHDHSHHARRDRRHRRHRRELGNGYSRARHGCRRERSGAGRGIGTPQDRRCAMAGDAADRPVARSVHGTPAVLCFTGRGGRRRRLSDPISRPDYEWQESTFSGHSGSARCANSGPH